MDGGETLVEHFEKINDPRIDRTKLHKLSDILVIGVVGVLCGADAWEDIVFVAREKEEWLKGFLELPNGIPSADTIARVYARVSPKELEEAFSSWVRGVIQICDGEIVPIDGKRLRASHDHSKGKNAIHMVSAWAQANGVVLGQIKVDDKSNEITAVPELLKLLEIKGCIVTLDAMGCQKNIAEAILKKEADYVFGLKGNQGSALEATKLYFDTTKIPESNQFETVDNDHGRLETRRYSVAPAADLPELSDWPGIQSIARVESTREIKETVSSETRYYIMSISPDAKTAAAAIRAHWSVENSLHWVLDVTFDEDRNRVRRDSAPENLAVVRHLALNLLKKEKTLKTSIKKKRLKCAMSNDYLTKVLAGAI